MSDQNCNEIFESVHPVICPQCSESKTVFTWLQDTGFLVCVDCAVKPRTDWAALGREITSKAPIFCPSCGREKSFFVERNGMTMCLSCDLQREAYESLDPRFRTLTPAEEELSERLRRHWLSRESRKERVN
jgi:NMD protein affecting ribosome stability and mRNA decay